MLYLLTLREDYEGTIMTFGLFDKDHIKDATQRAYEIARGSDDVLDSSQYLVVTEFKPNNALNFKAACKPKRIRVRR